MERTKQSTGTPPHHKCVNNFFSLKFACSYFSPILDFICENWWGNLVWIPPQCLNHLRLAPFDWLLLPAEPKPQFEPHNGGGGVLSEHTDWQVAELMFGIWSMNWFIETAHKSICKQWCELWEAKGRECGSKENVVNQQ